MTLIVSNFHIIQYLALFPTGHKHTHTHSFLLLCIFVLVPSGGESRVDLNLSPLFLSLSPTLTRRTNRPEAIEPYPKIAYSSIIINSFVPK